MALSSDPFLHRCLQNFYGVRSNAFPFEYVRYLSDKGLRFTSNQLILYPHICRKQKSFRWIRSKWKSFYVTCGTKIIKSILGSDKKNIMKIQVTRFVCNDFKMAVLGFHLGFEMYEEADL
jgi:hypothetical protein